MKYVWNDESSGTKLVSLVLGLIWHSRSRTFYSLGFLPTLTAQPKCSPQTTYLMLACSVLPCHVHDVIAIAHVSTWSELERSVASSARETVIVWVLPCPFRPEGGGRMYSGGTVGGAPPSSVLEIHNSVSIPKYPIAESLLAHGNSVLSHIQSLPFAGNACGAV